MQPHVSFDAYPSYVKPHSYNQQPSVHEQKGPLSPVATYPARNNYHYNYSPSHNSVHKQMNASVQEPFYRAQENQQPQSNKEKRQTTNEPILRDDGNGNNQANSSVHINGQSTNYIAKFSPSMFPKTSKILNLQKFIQQNLNLRNKLLQELHKIKQKRTTLKLKTIISQQHDRTKSSTRDTTPKRLSKDKASTLIDKRPKPQMIGSAQTPQALTQDQQLTHLMQLKHQKQQQIQTQKHTLSQLQKTNSQRRQHLHKLQAQTMNQSIHQTPLLRQKQLSIECLSVEIQWMNEKSTEIKRLVNNKNEQNAVFQMYEKMCREVERLRKENNKKSQKLKKLFEKTNQLTNKEENVNMFLMNLKV